MSTNITLVGGPTTLIDFEGLTILTDPTFDPPGEYPIPGGVLIKQNGPAIPADELPAIDLVTLSHAHHPDNLDASGAALLSTAKLVVGAPFSIDFAEGVTALDTWEAFSAFASNGEKFIVTAVPARHGPLGCEEITGIVTGFVIQSPTGRVLYITGDNAAVELVDEITERFPAIDITVLFTGAARVGLFDNAPLTLTAEMAVEVAQKLPHSVFFPAHSEGWKHFSEDREILNESFSSAGLSEKLLLVEPGESVSIH